MAIKVLKKREKATEKGVTQSGYREVTAMRILSGHKNVIHMYECFVENGEFYIVMEFGEVSLFDYLIDKMWVLSGMERKVSDGKFLK